MCYNSLVVVARELVCVRSWLFVEPELDLDWNLDSVDCSKLNTFPFGQLRLGGGRGGTD